MISKLIAAIFVTFVAISFSQAKSKKNSFKVTAKDLKIETLYNKKKYSSVIDLMAGQWSTASFKSLSYLANSFSALEQYSRQIKVLEFLKAKKPTHYIWYYKLGLAYQNLHEQSQKKTYQDSSAKNFRKVIELNPQFKPAYSQLLSLFAREGNLYEGRTIASVILRQFGSSPEVSQSLCKLYSLDGYIQEAIANCSAAIQESPQFGDSHMYLANAFLDKKDKLTAKKIFSQAAKNFPRSEFVQVTTGDFYLSENLYNSACKNYKKALRINKNSKGAHVGRAQCLFKLNKPKLALNHYVKACQLDSKFLKEFKIATGSLLTTGQDKVYISYESSLFKCHK